MDQGENSCVPTAWFDGLTEHREVEPIQAGLTYTSIEHKWAN